MVGKKLNKKKKEIPSRYLVDHTLLSRIHVQFDGDIWKNIDANDFCQFFNINNAEPVSIQIKFKGAFYILVHRLYKKSDILGLNRVEYIRKLLDSVKCKFSTYEKTVGPKCEKS